MKILVFNCGSSSLKFRLIDMPAMTELVGGEAQRVGPPTAEPSRIVYKLAGEQHVHQVPMPDHATALNETMKLLGANPSLTPEALGHRVVHGGAKFHSHIRIDDSIITDLEATQELAPIHNPPIIRTIKACRQFYPDLPQVAIFDTAFHASIPEFARTYALPPQWRENLGIRKYGFHGISHQYVMTEAARILGIELSKFNAVSCHLGSGGASLCAIVNGKSVDNTMGYSPLQGLVMSTRCGDLDPAVALQLIALGYGDHKAVNKMLNGKSGVLGLSGSSADIRDVLRKAAEQGEQTDTADVTAQVYLWRIRKYLGAYLTVVGHANAIIFTDTIGELVPQVREAVCSGLEVFGVKVDPERNAAAKKLPADVAADDSTVRVLAVATNEELAIARFSYAVLTAKSAPTTGGVA
jgi:acetate kinase